MNNYKSSSELKSLAKGQLLGKYGVLIGAWTLQICITMLLQLIVATFFSTTTLFDTVFYYFVSFLLSLIACIFSAGLSLMYLKTACHYQVPFQDVFWGFHHSADKIILLMAPMMLLEMLCMTPSYIAQYFMQTSPYLDMKLYGMTFLLYLVGMLLYMVLRLPFSQMLFLLQDFSGYSVPALYKASVRIMKGQKLRLLYLEISFIPLYLLSFFTCGIALLWVYPYISMTKANFYLELMAMKNKEQ